ncbi:MAG TPA: mannose-6-phosphate isomerase [Clostridia bacterium]|nr:mannose-6-phosphate isomerase [Clostridia bacterium]
MDKNILVKQPLFFERNRVFRVYLGGKGFTAFWDDELNDNMFPEEWVASKVKAINPKYFGERDGVSKIKGADIFFDDLLDEFPSELLGNRKYDCLVKFLDSAIRLPVQVHPTKEFSKKHFNSEYGKTEAWLVVATRPDAKIYFGFKDKITKEILSELEERSENEKDIMSTILGAVEAKVGDMYIINAGLIHAIGAGCTIIEVQEPTDFTIQPEKWCGDYHISYNEEFIGLDKSTALDCFNYDLYGEAAIKSAKIVPTVEYDINGVKKEVLISYNDTPCFAQNRYSLQSGGSFKMSFGVSVWICLDGQAKIVGDGYEKTITKGDYFYLPFIAENKYTVTCDTSCTLLECLPSKQQ